MHTLTENEMPSHHHGYDRFNYSTWFYVNQGSSGSRFLCRYDDSNFYSSYTTNYVGGDQPHNNMPPYITAYCWRRYR